MLALFRSADDVGTVARPFVHDCLRLLREPLDDHVYETPHHPYHPAPPLVQQINIPGASTYHVSFDPRCKTLDYLHFYTDKSQKVVRWSPRPRPPPRPRPTAPTRAPVPARTSAPTPTPTPTARAPVQPAVTVATPPPPPASAPAPAHEQTWSWSRALPLPAPVHVQTVVQAPKESYGKGTVWFG